MSEEKDLRKIAWNHWLTKEEFEVFQLELQQSSMSIKENDIAGSNE